jgi:hypothetical protein
VTASLEQRQHQRSELLREIGTFGDLRPGSISSPNKRCGKPSCHCARDGDPGHPGRAQLTSKLAGKTATETLSSNAARRKAEREIDEYRRFQQWSRSFVEVSVAICRLRPVEDDSELSTQEKKRLKRSNKKSPRK